MNNDLISREALKKALHNFFDGKVIDEPTYILRDVLCHIDNAPTVKPYCYFCGQKEHGQTVERPQGEWIEKVERRGCFAGDKTIYSYTCPFCGVKEFKKYPFCHCGADMRKGGAENGENDTN